jgi:hypothetical protein
LPRRPWAAAALRTLLPFIRGHESLLVPLAGGRARAAIEREKTLVLRSIKELEFDHAMGKVSDQDFADMGLRLRTRAAGLLRQLDAGEAYSTQIEQELARRLAAAGIDTSPRENRFCTQCGATVGGAPVLRPVRAPAGDRMTALVGRGFSRAVTFVIALAVAASAAAQQMPDPSLIHGKALPARNCRTAPSPCASCANRSATTSRIRP